jgi:hypothetical protein
MMMMMMMPPVTAVRHVIGLGETTVRAVSVPVSHRGAIYISIYLESRYI